MIIDKDDCLNSDDLQAVKDLSRMEYLSHSQRRRSVAPSRPAPAPVASSSSATLDRRNDLRERIACFDVEIKKYDDEIAQLKELRAHRDTERSELKRLLEAEQQVHYASRAGPSVNGKGKGKGIDYSGTSFDWDGMVKKTMRDVFKIRSFRLCQQGVVNANMDNRDVICVMPTGGGKSLTYQLPAILSPGVTLVISPLISLITDQILHLMDNHVRAVKLTSTTPKEETRTIKQQLIACAEGQISSQDEIKLCYVTPEKIAQNKDFRSLLQRLARARKLARIVIDEAHCVSQLGHDFRPDYQKLRVLRQEMPDVPIMALSATCPPKVLQDLIQVLGLRPAINGDAADTSGTVYFSSPLYRKNLHYKVVPKQTDSKKVTQELCNYILDNHPNDTGIVYCLSKKDAENVAEKLQEHSSGKIKTGVYHASVGDAEKERLHKRWRDGSVKVVCATIAFGLGIDKGDVRFVLHHSLSKSLDGFYQESGRAGRDGKDSDCVLFYRPQDGATLSGMTYGEKEGTEKLRAMLQFAQNLTDCRKVLFAKYFSHSSQISVSAWSTSDSDALSPCGHCDNCTRPPSSVDTRDVTLEVWQLLKIIDATNRAGGNLTTGMIAQLARGNAGGKYEVTERNGRRKTKAQETLDFDVICNGKVDLRREDIETLLMQMLIDKYLKEEYHTTAYAVSVYLKLGPLAPRLTRLSKDDLRRHPELKVQCTFLKAVRQTKKRKSDATPSASASGSARSAKRRKTIEAEVELSDDSDAGYETTGGADDIEPDEPVTPRVTRSRRSSIASQPRTPMTRSRSRLPSASRAASPDVVDLTEDRDSPTPTNSVWEFNQRGSRRPRKSHGRASTSSAEYHDYTIALLSEDN